MKPLAPLIAWYFRGMLLSPANVQSHLRFCDASPSECLVCNLVLGQIDQRKRRSAERKAS